MQTPVYGYHDRTGMKQVWQLQTGDIWSTLKWNTWILHNTNQSYLQYSQHILQFLQICHEAIQTLHAVELQGTLVSEILVAWSEREQTVSLTITDNSKMLCTISYIYIKDEYYEIWCHSSVDDDSSLLGCYTVI